MRTSSLKAKWRAGEQTFGAWLAIPDVVVAEAAGQAGFDYVCIDLQHGLADYTACVAMLAAISRGESTPVVRVPWNEPGIIGRVLDAGAMGVVIPMVNNAEEAQRAVAACRYAPEGHRSFGPLRASVYAGRDYYEHANAEVSCIPMVETKEAIDNLDAILDTPGVDAAYIGPADLSVTYGLPPAPDNDGPFPKALEAVVQGCRRRGVTPGIHANASLAPTRAAQGFGMVTASADFGALVAGFARDLKAARTGEPAAGVTSLY